MAKLFDVVETFYDPKNKPVHICSGKKGFYVYKPSSGFTSKTFKKADDESLLAILERQRNDAHTFATYLPGERNDKTESGNEE
jgi:hypothetical protein